jgi:hypothetical protein
MIDKITRYAFIAATIAVAILYYLLQKKEEKLQDVIFNLQKEKLEAKLSKARERMKNDKDNFQKHLDTYNKLRARYAPDILRTGAGSHIAPGSGTA